MQHLTRLGPGQWQVTDGDKLLFVGGQRKARKVMAKAFYLHHKLDPNERKELAKQQKKEAVLKEGFQRWIVFNERRLKEHSYMRSCSPDYRQRGGTIIKVPILLSKEEQRMAATIAASL